MFDQMMEMGNREKEDRMKDKVIKRKLELADLIRENAILGSKLRSGCGSEIKDEAPASDRELLHLDLEKEKLQKQIKSLLTSINYLKEKERVYSTEKTRLISLKDQLQSKVIELKAAITNCRENQAPQNFKTWK